MLKHLPNCLKSMHFLLFWTSVLVQRDQNMLKISVTITRKHSINSHAICRTYVMLINCKKKQRDWMNMCIQQELHQVSTKKLKTCCTKMHAYKCSVWTWSGNHIISLCICFASFTVVYSTTLSISRTIKDYEKWWTGKWRKCSWYHLGSIFTHLPAMMEWNNEP